MSDMAAVAQLVGMSILWEHASALPDDPTSRMLRGIIGAVITYADEEGIEVTPVREVAA